MQQLKLITAALIFLSPLVVTAAPIFTNSGVTSTPTNSATFDGLTVDHTDLSGYVEDGVSVSMIDPDGSYNDGSFSEVYYGWGGNFNWATISLVGGGRIFGLDFLLGDGHGGGPFGAGTTNLIWETFEGATATGFGDIDLARGTTVGWTDTVGFTSIRVAAYGYGGIDSFGQFQAIAIDDLHIDGVASVPEPATLSLLGLGILGLGFARRQNKS